jgi:hypothetical protein
MSLSQCVSDVSCYGFSVERIEEHYREWVVVPFFVVVSAYNECTHEYEYACFRSPERGDNKHAEKVLNVLQPERYSYALLQCNFFRLDKNYFHYVAVIRVYCDGVFSYVCSVIASGAITNPCLSEAKSTRLKPAKSFQNLVRRA